MWMQLRIITSEASIIALNEGANFVFGNHRVTSEVPSPLLIVVLFRIDLVKNNSWWKIEQTTCWFLKIAEYPDRRHALLLLSTFVQCWPSTRLRLPMVFYLMIYLCPSYVDKLRCFLGIKRIVQRNSFSWQQQRVKNNTNLDFTCYSLTKWWQDIPIAV